MYRDFKRIVGAGNSNYIYYWKSKGLSDERLNSITASSCKVAPQLSYYGAKSRVEFIGSCLKQDSVIFNHKEVVNIYIVYEIERSVNISSYPTLENCLFGAVKLTKHSYIDQYKYSGYNIGFDRKGSYSTGNEFGRNVITFGLDMISSPHIDNKKKYISILGKDPTQGLQHRLTVEKSYWFNFTKKNTKFFLSLHYDGANSYLFVNDT